jgi:hypothetical protein
MTTDVATVVNRALSPVPVAAPTPDLAAMGLTQREAASIWNVCKLTANTPVFAPPMAGNPAVVMGVALYLHANQIPISLVTLKRVHVWEEDVREKQPDGRWVTVGKKVCMQEDYRLLLGLLHRAGHDCWLESLDDERCTFVFIHRDHPGREQRFTFTMKMAERAGLTKKPNWEKNPHWMLPAAAVRMCARLGAPEATLGFDLGSDEGREIAPVSLPDQENPNEGRSIEAATAVGNDRIAGPAPEPEEAQGQTIPADVAEEPSPAHERVDNARGPESAGSPPGPTRQNAYARAIHIAAHEAGLTDDELDDIIRYVTGDPSANGVTRANKDQVLALISERAEGPRP